MQIYTKILIGMILGVGMGLTVGPKSGMLKKDLLHVPNPGVLVLHSEPGGAPSGVKLPEIKQGSPSQMYLLDQRSVAGVEWGLVRFQVSERMVLLDKTGRLKAGEEIRGWVKERDLPEARSEVGEWISSVLDPVGDLFLRLIKMVVVPLVFASLLVGVASLGDIRRLGRFGSKALGFFMLTTVLAISIGLGMANLIKPGGFVSPEDKERIVGEYEGIAGKKTQSAADRPRAVDNLLRIVPENPARAVADGDMLQIIFFAAFLGVALTLLPRETSQPVVAFFEAVDRAMVQVVQIIMKLAPYGVLALVFQVVGQSGISIVKALGIYALVVVAGLAIHAFAVYTSVVRVFGGIKVADFWRAARPAQLIAFSTSSSSATLPVTMECAEKRLGISNEVSSFVLPMGSTVNMDGTALYQGVAAIFIAQVFDIHLTLMDQLSVVLTATLASIGAAGVPGVGMITLALVLTSIGVPTIGVALILGVDRVLDMFRTAVNVTGDLCACVLVAATEGEKLAYKSPEQQAEEEANAAP